jgi:oxygen-dependent protoporphyrinogen oxidase
MIGRINQSKREATVVGAGIAGMLAAYVLDARGYRVTLIESNSRGGGLIRTRYTDFGIAESAAHSLIATEAVREVCRDLDVDLIAPRKDAKAKYVIRDGKLTRFPLTLRETLGAVRHAAFARSRNTDQQTLDRWAHRHLGDAARDYLLTPFVRGIYGVQPAELGVSTAFPFLHLPEGQTLLSAFARHRMKAQKKSPKQRVAPQRGMGELVNKLERRLEQRLGSRFRKGEELKDLPDAANVIIATPAYAAAQLLQSAASGLATELRKVRYTPLVSVTTFVERRAFERPVNGVGVLMPACEDTKSLGILFNSSSFEYRVTDDARLASFTVMMGGTACPQWLNAPDEEIQQAIKLELYEVLGIREPLATVIHRWPCALPQYGIDLPNVWQSAEKSWCAQPGHLLFGNYTGQISLRGMIESAVGL